VIRTVLLGATALAAPAVLTAALLEPRQAAADCAVTEGNGTVVAPLDGDVVTCTVEGGPETGTVGDGTTDATVVLEDDARIEAPVEADGISLDAATVALGDRAAIVADENGILADSAATVTLGAGASITSLNSDAIGVRSGDATVTLGAGARLIADQDGVYVPDGTATVTLGPGAGITAGEGGVNGSEGTTVTLGTGAEISAGGAGVYSYGGDTVVTLGVDAAIEGGLAGIAASGFYGVGGGNATVTLGSGASVTGGAYGIYGGTGGGDVIDSAGTISGGSGSVSLLGGDDRLILRTGSNLIGTADGGAGTDSVTLAGTGSEDESFVNFESLTMEGQSWSLSGSSSFRETTVAAGSLTVAGTLFSETMTVGAGGTLVTAPDGRADAYDFVANGNVVNNGRLRADRLAFGPGSRLSGNGEVIGRTTIGGRVAPGSSVGTLNFVGDTTLAGGSVLEVEVSPTGGNDRVVVSGGTLTIQSGAQLQVVQQPGEFASGQTFTFLSADGGIVGSFDAFEPPVISLTQQLALDAADPNALSFTVVTAAGDRLIADAPFNPVNGGPASLLPRFAGDDFEMGLDPQSAAEEAALTQIGFDYVRLDVDDVTVETWSLPFRRTFPLEDPGWAVVVNAPVTFADVEGNTAVSGSAGVGLQFPVTESWQLTPTVRLGGVYSDDFNTMALGYGGSLMSTFRFSFGDYDFELGNLVGYYRAEDAGGVVDDQIAYETENLTFRNGIVMSAPAEVFDTRLDTQAFVIDTRHTGDDLFVESYLEIGASVRPRDGLFGLPPVRVGLTGTLGDDVSGIRLNAGYRF
jgi:hypothetical protein